MNKIKQHKKVLLVIAVFLVLVGYGIYRNPDRKPVDSELQAIISESTELKKIISEEGTKQRKCFDDNDLETELAIADECISGLGLVVEKLESEPLLIQRMQDYRDNNSIEDANFATLVNDSLKLTTSAEYKHLVDVEIEYMNTHIEYFELLKRARDYEDQTLEEISTSITNVAQRIEDLSTKFSSAQTDFNAYLKDNYSEEFQNQLMIKQ